ncbi:MAG: hypothetical protein J7J91_11615 [Deltaproteobacteria bacterium]|nr:hypothetical protein [Deltaproteobacteria bacterium]
MSQLARYIHRLPIWIISVFFLVGCNQPTHGLPFDPNIEGLTLVKLATGDDAGEAINELHGKRINIVKGFVAHYRAGHDKATIWGSEAATEEAAKNQLVVMIHKMKHNRRSPFHNYRTLNMNDHKVIAFDGMGRVHYLFRNNKWLYWITADAKRIDKIFEQVSKPL